MPVRLALTATAAPPCGKRSYATGLRDPVVVIGDFDRPQLGLSRRTTTERRPRRSAGWSAQRGKSPGPGIVYAAGEARAQAAHDALASGGEQVTLYHAGLSGVGRRRR